MDDVIIRFEDFGFQYNAQSEPTLRGINLTVRQGEKILIAGPSGCGKSTLAHCVNGLIPFSYRGEQTGRLTRPTSAPKAAEAMTQLHQMPQP